MTQRPSSWLVRVDANAAIGLGHVMRCLGLAQAAARAGVSVRFAMHQPPPAVRSRLEAAGVAVVEIGRETSAFARVLAEVGASIVVIDGYDFTAADYEVAREGSRTCVAIVDDDGKATASRAHVIVNGNVYGEDLEYPPSTRLLVGPKFALIRDEFTHAPSQPRQRAGHRVVMMFGGSDPLGLSERMLEAVARTSLDFHPILVVGATNTRAKAILREGAALGLEVLHDVDDMPGLLRGVDLAVTAAGSTCLELAVLGVPALVVVTADNQRPVAAKLASLGIAEVLGNAHSPDLAPWLERVRALLADDARRALMAESGRSVVDGLGGARVVRALQEVVT